MKQLVVDSKKCTGCHICQLACTFTHHGVFNPDKSLLRIEIKRDTNSYVSSDQVDVPRVCLQCDPAPCQEACPVDAIERDKKTRALIIIAEKCTLCEKCISVCSEKVIINNSDKETIEKCDLCWGTPECVRWCPNEALSFMEAD